MTVYELNRDQLTELKQNYYTQLLDERGESPSYDELANIDDYISDGEIYAAYEAYSFTPGDFACSAAGNSEYSLELGDCLGDRDTIVRELRQIADAIENGYYSGVANYGTSWSIM